MSAGDVTGTVGVSDEGDLVATASRVQAVRPFAAAWEYMLDRAFVVAPHNPAFGGAALVDAAGAVIGITSLRLGEAPHVDLAIPIEQFLAGKDELIARGRVTSRAAASLARALHRAGGGRAGGLGPLAAEPGPRAGCGPATSSCS